MSENKLLKIAKQEVLAALDKAVKDFKVVALTTKEDRTLYDYINKSDEVELFYKPTVLPLKKFFFPQEEVLLEYTADGKVSAPVVSQPTVIFGVRPCDLNALHLMDEAFAEGHGDPNYLAKREKSVVIGMDCTKVCDENAFCYSVDANNARGGFDIMLSPVADSYVATVATEKGADFAAKYFAATTDASESDLESFKNAKKEGFAGFEAFKKLADFPEIFKANRDNPIWEEEGKKCLSCASCIMVCPTCYCFDVVDELDLNLKSGKRTRHWDACMARDFAAVAGNENFRESATARLHHRINRKFNYLMRKHGQSACVGCGRCVRACLAKINPKEIAEKITGEK